MTEDKIPYFSIDDEIQKLINEADVEDISEIPQKKPDEVSKIEVDFKEDLEQYYDYDKLIIDLQSKENIIQLTKKDIIIYRIYKNLLANNYMLYMHKGEKSYFIKRDKLHTIWKRTDLNQCGETFYSIEEPKKEKVNNLNPQRLVVVFSSMPIGEDEYFSDNIGLRCFTKNYPTIANHLIKGVLVMRIMDNNLSHGSHYLNTANYPSFETDVQNAILEVRERYEIDQDDVVLYGASKGGTGALYHSIRGNYKCVCVDPIISIREYNETDSDSLFLKDLRKENIVEDLIEAAAESYGTKYIIGSPLVPFNYVLYSQLAEANDWINMYRVFDNNIREHKDVSINTVNEQVTLINSLLMDSEKLHEMNEELNDIFKHNYSTNN